MMLFDRADGVVEQTPIPELVDEPTEVRLFQRCVVGFGDRVAATPDGVICPRSAKRIGQAGRRDREEDHLNVQDLVG